MSRLLGGGWGGLGLEYLSDTKSLSAQVTGGAGYEVQKMRRVVHNVTIRQWKAFYYRVQYEKGQIVCCGDGMCGF